jgi:hypothetical protein
LVERILYLNNIAKVVGLGNSYSSVIASSSLALVLFFYVFTISSYLQISTYILENRITYVESFEKHVINQYFDHILIAIGVAIWSLLAVRGNGRFYISSIYGGLTIIGLLFKLDTLINIIALSSVPIIILLLMYNKFLPRKKILSAYSGLTVNYLAIIGIIIGVVAVILSLGPVLSIPPPAISHVRNYAYDIFVLFSSFSSVLMFLLIFCFPVKLITNVFMNKRRNFKNEKGNNNSHSITSSFFPRAATVKLRSKIIYLTIFILLSITLVLIPHQLSNNQQIGVDTGYYIFWIDRLMRSNSTQEFVYQAFVAQGQDGDRPIALIFLFGIIKLVNAHSTFDILEHIPLILGPALVLVVYFLTRELTSNEISSLFASFLTAVSFHMLIGIYSGFYANWLAIIIGYLSAIFLFRFLKRSKKRDLIMYCILLVALLLTHVYTWTVIGIVFAVFLAVMLRTNNYRKKSILLLLLATSFSVIIDVARIPIAGSVSGIIKDTQIAAEKTGAEQFTDRWRTLTETVHIYVGGQFSNFILIVLGLFWLFVSNLRKASDIFIIIFISTGILPLFMGDWVVQLKVLYIIPFQIPAAIAMTYMNNRAHVSRAFLPVIIIWLIAMSIIAVSNFYFVPPSRNI